MEGLALGRLFGPLGECLGGLGGPWGQMDENFTLRGRPVKTACLTGRTFGLKCWFLEGSLGVLGGLLVVSRCPGGSAPPTHSHWAEWGYLGVRFTRAVPSTRAFRESRLARIFGWQGIAYCLLFRA